MRLEKRLFACVAVCLAASAASADTIAPENVPLKEGVVAVSLTGSAGDPAAGADVFKNKSLGNCLACHASSKMMDQQFHGEVGPTLDGAADRWEPGQLRAILVDAKVIFGEQTVMPGFYSLDVGENVRKDLIGKTILNAEQIEDLVAYLSTMKE